MEEVKAKSYTLRKENGSWLGQIILTSDGMFSAVTDYGNFSYAWRCTGERDFRKLILDCDEHYFGGKMYQGITYIVYGKKYEKAAHRFALEILPVLKKALKEDIEKEF